MIDSRIALSFQPTDLGVLSPNQIAGQQQQLTNLRNVGQLQTGQIQAQGQENQARDLALRSHAQLNRSILDNTKTDENGKITIDHDAVGRDMAKFGYGAEGQEYADTQKKTDLVLKNLTLDQAIKTGQMYDDLYGVVGALKNVPAGPQRDAAWQQLRPRLLSTYKGVDPSLLSEQTPDDAALTAYEYSTKQGLQNVRERILKQQADTQAAAEKDRAALDTSLITRNTAMGEYYMRKDAQGNWVRTSDTRGGRAVLWNPQTREETLGGPVDMSDSRRGLTANGEATQQRFVQREINDARDDLDEIHKQRTTLGNALKVQKGKDFINPLTKKSETMDDETRATLEEQFNNVTNKGKRIMRQWGGQASNGVIGADEFANNKPDSSATPPPKGGGAKEPLVYVPGKGVIPKSQVK